MAEENRDVCELIKTQIIRHEFKVFIDALVTKTFKIFKTDTFAK